ncbi:MAG TPA: cytochrome D1 domain-containing protein [Bryobacteraceae bacterium]|nr:cytochrome D1 domain-containing protein [Bryobacteraceae bacterium]
MMRLLLSCCLLLPLLAYAADPSYAVLEKVAGRVSFYDRDFNRIGEVKVGAFPHEAALSPDRRTLYVSVNGVLWMTEDGRGNNTVAVVDVPAMKKTADIDLGKFHRPHGITFDPKSRTVLATTERPFGLVAIDPAARKVTREYDVQGKSPHMVAVTADGTHAWVSNTDSNSIAVISIKQGTATIIPTGEKPQGGVFSPDGSRFYVTLGDTGALAVIDTKTMKEVTRIESGKNTGRVALTPDGRTLVYNTGDSIAFADTQSLKQLARSPVSGRPMSLTMTRDGKLAFAGIQENDKLIVVDVANRKIAREVTLPKGSGPDPVIPID